MKKLRLDQALVEAGLAPSRRQAQALIMTGQVRVDGKLTDKAGHLVADDAELKVLVPPPYVSRGGEKLASVAEQLKLDFKGKVVMDVGASTGGFSDYALKAGAQKIYSIDVGTGQLDYRLRTDEKVVVMEKTDIRDVAKLPDKIDLVLVDVSFISLRLVLPAVVKLAGPNTPIVALAKPHFEADYKTASMHRGVIKNNAIRRQILKKVEDQLKHRFKIVAKADSKVTGRKGNRERFYLLKLLASGK